MVKHISACDVITKLDSLQFGSNHLPKWIEMNLDLIQFDAYVCSVNIINVHSVL